MSKGHSRRANNFDAATRLKRNSRKNSTLRSASKTKVARIASSMVETLEGRTLMSNSVALTNGILYIEGNPTQGCSLTASLVNGGKSISASADNAHAKVVALSAVKQIQITGGSASDTIYVDQNIKLPVTISGGAGNDQIRGGGGANTIMAGNGNNWISGRGATNYIQVGNGANTVMGSNGNDTVIAGNGNNNIDGADGNDTITAGNGNNNVTADAGNDTIVAGNGINTLNGGLGNDHLTVGTGASTLVPGSGTNAIVRGSTAAKVVSSAGSNSVVTQTPTATGTKGSTSGTTSGTKTGTTGTTSGSNAGSTGGTTGGSTTGSTTGTSTSTTPPATPAAAGSGATGTNGWLTYTAPAAGGTNPQAVLQILAPAPTVGIAIVTRALNSKLGNGSPIDANYQWNFGDPAGQHNQLTGFNAAHVYTVAGNYTISLTITNALHQTSTVSATIKITPDTRRLVYVNNATGNDRNNGSNPNAPVKTAGRASQLVGDNTEILFARGQTYDLAAAFKLNYRNVLVGAYGTGNQPVINYTSPTTGAVIFTTNSNKASGVTVEDLTLTTLNGTQPKNNKMPMGVMAGGYDTAVLRCTFNYVEYDINASAAPIGLTVFDNRSPINGGLQGYFVWDEGTDSTIVGNYVNGSVHEHIVRTSGATELLIAQNDFANFDGKGGIEIHVGGYAWIDSNTVEQGDIRVGPLGLWGEPITDSTDYCVIQNNHVNNTDIAVFPGAHDISIRNNIINRPGKQLIDVRGQDGLGRQTADIRILNNTGINTSTTGNFLKIESHTDSVLLENNLLIQPNLAVGGYTTAPVYVNEGNLSSFTFIGGNVWQQPKTIYQFAQGGINFVGATYVGGGYKKPAAWNAYANVGTDYFSSTPINYSNFAPQASSLASIAGSPVNGVFSNIYGTPRAGATWTAGAV